MALSLLQCLEMSIYAAAFICGIVSAALVTVTQGEFGSGCILYGVAKYNSTAKSLVVEQFGSVTLCGFVSAVSVGVAIYCFCTVFYFIYSSFIEETDRGSRWLTACLVTAGIFLFLLLVAGCLLRVGLSSFCQSLLSETRVGIKSCADSEKMNWTSSYNGSRFYQNFTSAETSTWVNFFFWLVVLTVLVVQWRRLDGFRPMNGADPEWSTAVAGITSETKPLIPSGTRP
ncbi:transmembrane protein 179B-like [Chiloscyllium punctatum]|uniref:transmembrane protein 179B-like n=1 Tax=Chiloscyllium punctatum TaxID=137246 RepID=UPI003B638390